MRDDDCGDVLTELFEEVEVGDAHVNAVRGLFRKTHAYVDEDHILAVSQGHAVASELAESTQGGQLNYITHFVMVLSK
jgi:hypothetical protein